MSIGKASASPPAVRTAELPSSEGLTTTPIASEAAAREWVTGFAEGWRAPAGPAAFCAHFRKLLAPDVRLVQPQLPTTVGHRASEEQFAQPLFALIPDLHGEVERWAARGDSLYIELTLRGTLAGRAVCRRLCDRVTLRSGVAVERESYFDPLPLLATVAMRPRAWPRMLRLQARRFTNDLAERSKR
jgi:hypothetical protein